MRDYHGLKTNEIKLTLIGFVEIKQREKQNIKADFLMNKKRKENLLC